MLKIKFIGAAGMVTGSCTLLQFNHSQYLVDCGMYQGPREIRQRNWETQIDVKKIKAILLTHAHIDHSGLIPKVVKEGFRGPIYCSSGTADLCRIMLPDSGYLQEEDARFANERKYSKHFPAEPLYTQKDAVNSLAQLSPGPLNEWIELEPGLSIRFLRSGHILGSTFIQVYATNGERPHTLTFSGDLGHGSSFILRPPVHISETDSLVLESTYGDRVQKRGGEDEKLAEIINKVIRREGTLVIPAFTVGRTQEILYLIAKLETQNKIPKTTVYLDSPMAQDVTELFSRHKEELSFELVGDTVFPSIKCTHFKSVKSADDSMLLCMNTDPKIVISAAGMLTGGRVLHHLKAKLPDPKSAVLFVGYQVEGTKGYLLKNGMMNIRIHHQNINVEAEIYSIDTFSAHADSNELISWVKNMNRKPRQIFVNHGEKSALEALAYRLRHELEIDTEVAKLGESYSLA